MAGKYESGDVHAPVEDVEVPLGLKVLVITMLAVVVGGITILVVVLEQAELLVLPWF